MGQASEAVAGGCHCGGVRFTARLSDGLASARRCTCSYCRMRGAVALTAVDLSITAGEALLTEYRFNTMTARHWFCSRCGIYTHHARRSDPGQIAVNLACLDGMSPFDLRAVPVSDGVAHPSDNEGRSRRAGVLRFEPDEG